MGARGAPAEMGGSARRHPQPTAHAAAGGASPAARHMHARIEVGRPNRLVVMERGRQRRRKAEDVAAVWQAH
jgi:hypothetical protein